MKRLIILSILLTASGPAVSDTAWLYATVTRTLVEGTNYGACMIMTDPGPETVLPGCGSRWVTFSCSGDFNTKSEGNLKFQTAQLSFLTAENLALRIDDTKKHNGYCFARRLDLYK